MLWCFFLGLWAVMSCYLVIMYLLVFCVVLCCVVLWCVVLCCGVLWCVVVCCGVLWCGVLWCVVVCCVVVCCGVLWCGVVWCWFGLFVQVYAFVGLWLFWNRKLLSLVKTSLTIRDCFIFGENRAATRTCKTNRFILYNWME